MIISKCDMALSLYRHLYFVVKYSSKTVEDGSIIENSSKEASTLFLIFSKRKNLQRHKNKLKAVLTFVNRKYQ